MNKKDIICQMPFYSMDITPDQTVAPCCRFTEKKQFDTIDADDIFYSDYFENIRNSIRQGIPVKGCSVCYKDEANGEYSLRQLVLDKYKKMFGVEFDLDNMPETRLRSLVLAFGNVCNNKCRMCNIRFSTSWYADYKKLGLPVPKGEIKYSDFLGTVDFSHVRLLQFVGGEPLMYQDKIIELLESKCDLENLTVVFTTNVTLLPSQELINILNRCKKVEWNLSIDAYGKLNDFLRKGSVWSQTKSNLDWYCNNYNEIRVNSAISIYNVNCFADLTKHLSNYKNVLHSIKMVHYNDWMMPRNLPEYAKKHVKEYVLQVKKEFDFPLCDVIIDELSKTGNFKLFCERDRKLNDIRNEHWKDANIELYNLIKEDIL